MLQEMKITEFVDALAAKTSVPGGGAASAASAAMGAALGIMAAQYSDGPRAAEAVPALQKLKSELVAFIDADADAYAQVSAAYGLSKKSDDEKAKRREAIQSALVGASDVPLRAMKASLAAMKATATYIEQLNKNLVSDFSGAILLLEAGLVGCGLNVRINAGLMSDKARGAALESEADRIEKEAAALKTSLLSSVQKMYAKK